MADPQTDTYYLGGVLLRFLVRDPDAGYCLVEGLVRPRAGSPAHRHPADDEAYYVLDGTFRFVIGPEIRIASAGAFVRIPRGEVHAFENIGQVPGRLLILNLPGTAHASFFSQAGEPRPSGATGLSPPPRRPDLQRLLETAERNGIEFVKLYRSDQA